MSSEIRNWWFVYSALHEKITPVEANNILETWRDLFLSWKDRCIHCLDQLQWISRLTKNLQSALEGTAIPTPEILNCWICQVNIMWNFCQTANHLRQRQLLLCPWNRTSNICKNNCAYCGYRHTIPQSQVSYGYGRNQAVVKQASVDTGSNLWWCKVVKELFHWRACRYCKNNQSILSVSYLYSLQSWALKGWKHYTMPEPVLSDAFRDINRIFIKVCQGRSLEKINELAKHTGLGILWQLAVLSVFQDRELKYPQRY